jgi:putative heme-binding domain-containing protein
MNTLRICRAFAACIAVFSLLVGQLHAQQSEKEILGKYRAAALKGGDAKRGLVVFKSKESACTKCHVVSGTERKAGPGLQTIGDKFTREQLIKSVLEPSARIHPDHATTSVTTTAGKVLNGVLQTRTKKELQLLDGEGKLVRIPLTMIEFEKPSVTSLMPTGLYKTVNANEFADLIAFLESQRQKIGTARWPGMPNEMLLVKKPARLERLHSTKIKFDHPVCVIASPTNSGEYFVVEQKTRKIWRLDSNENPDKADRSLFVDLSDEASTGQFEGVVCLAFHPQFKKNRKYYVNYHVRNQGSHFSPIIAERKASKDLQTDAGGKSRRVLQIHQDTDLHWGGMLTFGPDGFLYIGAGDAGPQEDPQGNSQNLGLLPGSILRIDVDNRSGDLPYAIPKSNPFRTVGAKARPEIWGYGFRMPWRFSFDSETGDLWVGDIGQNLFENVRIARLGENHGWNIYEGFERFSERYRKKDQSYVPPVLSYRRKDGVSVTGGYVYRANKKSSYYGAFIFGDFESKKIWAMTQKGRKLVKVRQIGSSPEKISSFGIDENGEILVVGYEGTIFRLNLDDSTFE